VRSHHFHSGPALRPGWTTPTFSLRVVHLWITPNTVVVRTVGEVDVSTVGRLRDELAGLAAAGALNVVLDVAGIAYMGAAGISALLVERDSASARSGSFCLVSISAAVARPLAALGLLRLFDDYEDLGSALAELICDPALP
jgi:anti-sigma B factor antagonist